MPEYDFKRILNEASDSLMDLKGLIVDVVEVKKPDSIGYAINLSKVISKLSPLIGNMIEYQTVDFLNEKLQDTSLKEMGKWERQDPGFPDTIFRGNIEPTPGIEIKTWFPLATEITARFKDSQKHFLQDQTNVAMVAWIPEFVFFGKPKVLDVFIDTASSVAEARDKHYHRPPSYIIFEPEDTTQRTRNLQQTNTNGYRFQGTNIEISEAEKFVREWGENCLDYDCGEEYQSKLRELMGRFKYRLDTNYAKMDRIEHTNLEMFKTRVLSMTICGKTINEWSRVVSNEDERAFEELIYLARGQESVDIENPSI